MRWSVASVAVVAAALVVPSVAQSADMPVRKAAPVAVVPAFSWTGFYIGGHVGYGWSDVSGADPTIAISGGSLGSHSANGFLGGGQIGFNWQAGAWVLGVEADVSWTNLEGNNLIPPFNTVRHNSETSMLATVAGRLGYAFGPTLLYAKGGGAYIDREFSNVMLATAATIANPSNTEWGWMVGAGVEHAFTPNWSVKFEYNYMDFSTTRLNYVFLVAGGAVVPIDISQDIHAVKLGINYRFGWR